MRAGGRLAATAAGTGVAAVAVAASKHSVGAGLATGAAEHLFGETGFEALGHAWRALTDFYVKSSRFVSPTLAAALGLGTLAIMLLAIFCVVFCGWLVVRSIQRRMEIAAARLAAEAAQAEADRREIAAAEAAAALAEAEAKSQRTASERAGVSVRDAMAATAGIALFAAMLVIGTRPDGFFPKKKPNAERKD